MGFEPTTSRLKGEYSTLELLFLIQITGYLLLKFFNKFPGFINVADEDMWFI